MVLYETPCVRIEAFPPDLLDAASMRVPFCARKRPSGFIVS
jgi:hypothetical protein